MPAARELGIAVTAYGVLSRGLLSGSEPAAAGDLRAHLPRFRGENYDRNRRLVDALRSLAAQKGVTPSQTAIAWVASKGPDIIPVMGARTRAQLDESLGALGVRLTDTEIAHLEETFDPEQVAGTRYNATQMRMLDSER